MTGIQRHTAAATILYLMIPYFFPEHRSLMGTLLTVEIARRVFDKQTIDMPHSSYHFHPNQGHFYLLLHFREHHPMY